MNNSPNVKIVVSAIFLLIRSAILPPNSTTPTTPGKRVMATADKNSVGSLITSFPKTCRLIML